MINYIFAGRFQPFHNGHLEVVKSVLSKLTEEDNFVIAIVSPFDASHVVDDNFHHTAIEHHLPERNPWSVSERTRALANLVVDLSNEFSIIPSVTAIPRPDYGWQIIEKWFPETRVWVIPNAGEEFDESKAIFFHERGDEVWRVDDHSQVSGYELRKAIKALDFEYARAYIPVCMQAIYLKS